jgi:plasmid stabilization system protein ParE
MISYRFLSPAEEEMTEAALFYEMTASARLGTDFLDDVQRAIDRLRKYPQSGEPIAGESIALALRRTLLHRFPFSLIYAIEENAIVIIAVAHHGRRPGYWQSRVHR